MLAELNLTPTFHEIIKNKYSRKRWLFQGGLMNGLTVKTETKINFMRELVIF
jgi:hypothetical protein